MTWTAKAGACALAVALIFGAGMGAGWMLWSPKAVAVETYAREVRQTDGSLVLERKPQADAKPAQQVPAGARVERVIQVTVKPSASAEVTPRTDGTAPKAGGTPQTDHPNITLTPCPPVRLDLTLVRMPDQSRRVVASSPDGEVVAGVDIPVEPSSIPRKLPWAAGGIYGVTSGGGRSVGAFIHRDAAFLRLGAEVTRDTPATLPAQWTARALVGIRF